MFQCPTVPETVQQKFVGGMVSGGVVGLFVISWKEKEKFECRDCDFESSIMKGLYLHKTRKQGEKIEEDLGIFLVWNVYLKQQGR